MGQDTLKRLLTARVVRTPPKMTEDEQLYRDLVNIRPEGKSRGVGKDGEPLPPVPDAPGFRPQPLVTGTDPDFLSSVNRIMRIAPEMNDASRLAEIRHGHTKGSMERHINSKMAPDMFGLTNLLGLFDRRDKTIGISPNAVRNLPPYTRKTLEMILYLTPMTWMKQWVMKYHMQRATVRIKPDL